MFIEGRQGSAAAVMVAPAGGDGCSAPLFVVDRCRVLCGSRAEERSADISEEGTGAGNQRGHVGLEDAAKP